MQAPALSIKSLLQHAREQLINVTDTPSLDAEVLLAFTLSVSRTYLFTHPERTLKAEQTEHFQQYIARRCSGEPIAYITGIKEFWSLSFKVTRATLIPRPETERLVEWVLQQIKADKKIRLADLGTGSGAIAISLSHERPAWEIYATDISKEALQVASENAKQLQTDSIHFHQGSWCEALPAIKFDVIVSNPPYIAEKEWDAYQAGLAFEPVSALLSPDNGLADIATIITQAKAFLQPGGYLFLEHGFSQGEDVRALLALAKYEQIATVTDTASKERITMARYCYR